jgi:hypothetical protein
MAVGCDRYPLGEEIISVGDAELFRAMMCRHYSKAQLIGAGLRSGARRSIRRLRACAFRTGRS